LRHYLIVDDNQAFAENLAEIIRDHGDEAAIATSGAHALSCLKTTRFDALVTDMKMPVMGGAQLVHEVRRVDPGLPAIVVSAYTGDNDLAAAKHEGILAVLPKPVPMAPLLKLLAMARRDGIVALVEDDLGLSDNLAETLRERGFTAVTAHSLKDTARLGEVKPFAALVDLRIPGSPQGEALGWLRSAFRELPIAIMTGYPELVPSLSGHVVFEKPFETAKVLEHLEHVYTSGART
jgi:CheY-like chemotaxis protein